MGGDGSRVGSGPGLQEYRRRRDFRQTGEPRGEVRSRRRKQRLFVIQEHEARRLAARLADSRLAPLPRFVRPQLATLVTTPPEGEEWLHEIKLDGYRVQVRLDAGEARIRTRQGHDWTARFERLAETLASLPAQDALADGEVVAFDARGASDFAALQQALSQGAGLALHMVLFDLLHLDGHDLRLLPLVERKELLRQLLAAAPGLAPAVRYGEHVRGGGTAFFRHACRLEVEGMISKRAGAPYREGRSRTWLKIKCGQRQELVVVGFTEPRGSRTGFGALLLAYYDDERALCYAGRVGTGFDHRTLTELRRRLQSLERETSPLQDPPPISRGQAIRWVEPRLVVEVSFAQWTAAGLLRQASFVGIRADKAPEEVRRERAQPTRQQTAGSAAAGGPKASGSRRASDEARWHRPRAAKARRSSGDALEIAGVRLTHPERVLYSDVGITKRQLAEYYVAVADVMLPELAGRPLTLLRCPSGQGEECFYQKRLAEARPPTLVPIEIEERSGNRQTYIGVDSTAGLVSLAQLGVLEIHPWGSRAQHLEQPDRLIFDLDPGPGVGWAQIVAAARALRDLLRGLDLESFLKLTGGKGLHLVVPVAPELDWGQAKELTRALARILEQDDPRTYTTNPSKSQRPGKIFIDYLRNGFGATAVAAYSTRARPGVPVAVPVRWDELTPSLAPDRYHLTNVRRRLAALARDPWGAMTELEQRIRPEILSEIHARG